MKNDKLITAPLQCALITIGITCFNARSTIARAIKSALDQDWPNIEIIVVDDCSTDDSVANIEPLIAGRTDIELIRHAKNAGPAAARNTILAQAKGEFIAFFDDDDISLLNRVSNQVSLLQDYEQRQDARLIACYASGRRRYDGGYELELPAIGSQGETAPHGTEVADYLLLYRRRADRFYGTGTPTCSLMARKSTFDDIGGFDSALRRVEDADFAIRLALRGGHFIGTREPLFVQYSTNSDDKSPEKNLTSEQRIVEKHRDYLDKIGSYYYAWHWPKLRYWHFKRKYLNFTWELINLFARYPIATSRHFWATGPQRLLHEKRIRERRSE
ncbi:glycosyltransferase family 2 protein [Thalassospira mesophila]|uniref:Glycosyltransferase 2-like domain-containing protein n=1 Tax=Thalassospira mesophila TaxID=1293891 RepID=A0A1Y2L5Q5_9PROT|nr:glycosyltransferase family 2 protein [Thalassospira mesophila]OSQ40468.1 hypothetical protein TMES_01350 [Thalassospira mesophila]